MLHLPYWQLVFLLGAKRIQGILKSDGVVLTRAWASAFDYIQGVDESQAKLLKNIYNSYYNSPIQLRDEIVEHNNVTWVRAFRFIFSLWESYLNGSFIDVLKALKLYTTIDARKLTPKINGFIIAFNRQLSKYGVRDYQFYSGCLRKLSIDFSKDGFPYTSSQYRKFSGKILAEAFDFTDEELETT